MRFTIDFKMLSNNEAWKGGRVKSQKYRDFENAVLYLLPRHTTPIEGPVEIRYKFYMKNHKMADWDNPIKSLQDVLVTGGIIKEDRFIYLGMAQKIASDKDYAEVQILPYVERDIFD